MRSTAIFFSWAMRARLHRLAGGDLGFFGRAAAGDIERADALFLLDARRRHHLARGDVALLERAGALDLERPRGKLGGDALGGERLFARDARAPRSPCAAAISSSSIARLRVISRRRISSSSAIRSSVTTRSWAMRARSVVSRAAISACSILRVRSISSRRFSSSLRDARRAHREFLRDARLLGFLARGDLGILDIALPLDLATLVFFLAGDAGFGKHALLRDAGALDALARGDLRLVDLAAALDLALADVALGGDARLRQGALVGDAGFFHFLAAGDLRLLGLGVAQRPLAGEFGALYRAPHFDIALLIEARGLAFAVDFQRLLLGFEIAAADEDHQFLLDVVAQLAAGFDVLDELGQALGVEAVRRIEEFEVGLVEIGDRDRFKLQAVPLQSF